VSEPEDFLSRWSRRKQEVREDARKQVAQEPRPLDADKASARAGEPEKPRAVDKPADQFDLSKLPSLDSITAQTDIRDFLRPGVPAELTRAALRRAWIADPAIRDFVGLQEYDWDFNAPDGIAGFGPLGSEHDLKKLAARVFGDVPLRESEAEPSPAPPCQQPPQSSAESVAGRQPEPESGEPTIETAASGGEMKSAELLQRKSDIAMQHEATGSNPERAPLRRAGGALPKRLPEA
jgi:hypothetical protein